MENSLFGSKREAFWFFSALTFIFAVSIFYEYSNFLKTKEYPYYKTTADVYSVNIREKNGRAYSAIELRCDNGERVFCAKGYDGAKLAGNRVDVVYDSSHIDFVDYLKGFRAKVHDITPLAVQEQTQKKAFRNFIASQHDDNDLKELYVSLFFETKLSDRLQQKINDFGLSAVMSLSGLNLTLLSALMFFILAPPYKALQERYFPYRDRNFDISVVVLVTMSFYAYLTGFADPFVRALIMALVAFWLLIRGVLSANITTLLITIVCILALSPRTFFSFSFWLSIVGVYYIFLFLRHTVNISNFSKIALLSVYVYSSMGVIARFLFGTFSPWQLTSPITSIIFDFFYPIAVVLHIVGFGWIFDPVFSKALEISTQHLVLSTPSWFVYLFVIVSIGAWRSELAFWLTAIFGVLFTFFSTLSFFY